jgi:hypothetical protein
MYSNTVRKSIARVLTVTNQKARQNIREYYKNKKYLPLDLRPKKTRAIRRRLTKVIFLMAFSPASTESFDRSKKNLSRRSSKVRRTLTFHGGSMLSRHDTILFYGIGRLDVYSLYVHMPHAVSHISHHARLVKQIGCLTSSTTESRQCTFSCHVTSSSSGYHCSAQSPDPLVRIYYRVFISVGDQIEELSSAHKLVTASVVGHMLSASYVSPRSVHYLSSISSQISEGCVKSKLIIQQIYKKRSTFELL